MEVNLVVGLILSCLIGFSLGLIGGGGSIITVPVLVYVLNVAPHEAITMSLAVVGATSLIGAFLHWRRGTVQFKSGLIFGAAGIVGAFAGSPLTKLLSPDALLLSFAGLMLVVSVIMMRKKPATETDVFAAAEVETWKALTAGFGVGVLTGFLGVGGGFLIVPALVMFGGLAMKEAVGTSLLVIFLNCVAGLIGHASQDAFDWQLTFLVVIVAATGAVGGTLLSQRLAAGKLQKVFAAFVFLVGVFLIFKNYSVLM